MADATRRVSVRLSLDDGARVKAELRQVGEAGQRSMQQIRDSAADAGTGLRAFDAAVRAVQVLALAAGIRAVAQAGDQLTASMGRLNTALGSVERAGEIYNTLYRDSLRTGIAVTESVAAFQRFSIAAQEIGATSDQVATLVGGLQRVAIVSGASQQEIASATQQLGQALASGVLQGDELRSILEAMPRLAQGLARELGVSIGELRKMGAEGKLTADTVFPALLRAVERLNGEFEKAPLTLSRAFGQLNVASTEFVARLDEALGFSQAIARALSSAASGLDGARRGAGLLNPVEQREGRRAQADALQAEIAGLEADGQGASLRAQPRRGSIRAGLVGTANDQNGLDRVTRLREARDELAALSVQIENDERDRTARGAEERATAADRASESRRRRAAEDTEKLLLELDDRYKINQDFAARVTRLRESEASGAIDGPERARLQALALEERDAALARIAGTTQRGTAATRENRDAEREVNDVVRDRERLIQANETAQEKYARRIGEIAAVALRSQDIGQPLSQEQLQRATNAAQDDLFASQQRLQDSTAQTSDVARELGLTFSSAFEDAVVKGEKLQTVLQGVLQDISRLTLRKAVTEPLVGALSGVLGGLGGGAGTSLDLTKLLAGGGADGGLKLAANGAAFGGAGVIPFANGGVIDRPTLFPFSRGTGLMGEAGPEAILPLRRGRDGKLGVASDGGGAMVTITINSPDADGFRRSADQVTAAVADGVRRGGRLR